MVVVHREVDAIDKAANNCLPGEGGVTADELVRHPGVSVGDSFWVRCSDRGILAIRQILTAPPVYLLFPPTRQ